ncbi:MAG: hypothetical protein DMG07_18165 [Acidobacteria bacterium]|nr:MAG: hypothetical protein DMG07_18165 [Acidobacteriota bacterium]
MLTIVFGLSGAQAASAAGTVTVEDGRDQVTLTWRGDETIQVGISKSRGLIGGPVSVRVDNRRLTFDGFYARFNGQESGFTVKSVKTAIDGVRLQVSEVLEHPQIPEPIPVDFTLWMEANDKALRVKVAYPEGKLHLDQLGLGNHHGAGIEPERIFLTKMLVMNGPFEPFDLKYNYNGTRYWCFRMANGISELQGCDRGPRGFACDPKSGRYDFYSYCDSPITYTLVFTGKGEQEAIGQFRSTLHITAPATMAKLIGRNVVMTNNPIKERYEDFLDEITSRGMRDFLWVAYWPHPGDRALVEPYGALYGVYDMYTDLFIEGPRRSKTWLPEWAMYTEPGKMYRGYHNSLRIRPDKYLDLATTRVHMTFGHELGGGNFTASSATRYSNLAIIKKEIKPTFMYLDVHVSKGPIHYWDNLGRHHPARDYLEGERRFFEWTRHYLGDIPLLSEATGEAYAGIMDGGAFEPWPTPAKLGIKCRDWDYYPFIDQVHREHLVACGVHWPLTEPEPNEMSQAILFGRAQGLSAYRGVPQDNPGRRVRIYYLTSAFNKMLGLAKLERIDFADDDIHRAAVTYANGARAWINRGDKEWDVRGYRLPKYGYLVEGPGDSPLIDIPKGFQQYRALEDGKVVEVVRSRDYQYWASETSRDFGPVTLSGAGAARVVSADRVVLYELEKPGISQVRLSRLSSSLAGRKVARAWARLTRGRLLELKFPNVKQDGDVVSFYPMEMATCVGFGFELVPVGVRSGARQNDRAVP